VLTDLLINKLPLSDKRREVPDGKLGGLYLVMQPSGAKSWALRYRVDGIPKKLTIGTYPAISLAAARRRAQEALGEVAGGKDPAAIKRASRAAARAEREAQVDRVERVVEQFVERHAKPKTRDWRQTERMLEKEIVGRWCGRRLSQLTRAHVHEMLDEIVDRGAPIRANRIFAQIRKMCNWAVSRGIIDRSPCDGMMAPSVEASRDRVLSDDEIRAAWAAFHSVGWPFGLLAQLLLLTGQRLREVGESKWPEFDLDTKTWTIPKERAKNGVAHEVPLSEAALRVIAELHRIEAKSDDKSKRKDKADYRRKGFVFTTNGKTPVSGFSRAKDGFDKAIIATLRQAAIGRGDDPDKVDAPAHWTLHDLRRTAASGMAGLGIAPNVVEAVLNHKSGSIKGVAAVYNRYGYGAEKRAALEAWGRCLDALIGAAPSSNIVEFAKTRA
jgi:integrase